MLRIRLTRVGAKKQPSYRLVVAEARWKRDGRVVDRLGHYDPKTDPPTFEYDEDKTLDWLRKGAQPSDPVLRMLKSKGTMDKIKQT